MIDNNIASTKKFCNKESVECTQAAKFWADEKEDYDKEVADKKCPDASNSTNSTNDTSDSAQSVGAYMAATAIAAAALI